MTLTKVKRLQNKLIDNRKKTLFLPPLVQEGKDKIESSPREARSNSIIALMSNFSPSNYLKIEDGLKTDSNSGFKAERAFLERLINHKDT